MASGVAEDEDDEDDEDADKEVDEGLLDDVVGVDTAIFDEFETTDPLFARTLDKEMTDPFEATAPI